ncbi:helix-turn-helix domain-containing protein [Siphonobacter sp.]|uniref:helix-turn-helix domain-containing protein n=1 Tax=Siphonobacter sp. TaxID=1869184 RepID=UPI003B3ADA27
MATIETLEDFYQTKFNEQPPNLEQNLGHFNVFRLEDCHGPHGAPVKYTRRDFYKISLIRGKNVFHYADKSLEVEGPTLMFFNPKVPYTWESRSEDYTGFFCIFKDAFFTEKMRDPLSEMPMFASGGKPAFILPETQEQQVSALFEKMLAEMQSDYRFKYDLLRNYVIELIHVALKVQPSQTLYQHPDANARITAIFSELLERQFPIETPSQRFKLRSAKDFAEHLAVHVNHLNRAIRQTTGKTTTDHITERLTSEAKALLKHTNWNIAEISYCLGFEEPSHFNNFFKKHVSLTPSAYRYL